MSGPIWAPLHSSLKSNWFLILSNVILLIHFVLIVFVFPLCYSLYVIFWRIYTCIFTKSFILGQQTFKRLSLVVWKGQIQFQNFKGNNQKPRYLGGSYLSLNFETLFKKCKCKLGRWAMWFILTKFIREIQFSRFRSSVPESPWFFTKVVHVLNKFSHRSRSCKKGLLIFDIIITYLNISLS